MYGGFGRHGAGNDWFGPLSLEPTETEPDETRYDQIQSGRICPMVSFSAHRGLMPVSLPLVNIMNDVQDDHNMMI